MDLALGTGIMPKPFQKPRPEIVGTVVAPFSKGVIAMGERDFHPLSANFLLPQWLPSHWTNYAEGKVKAGVKPDPAQWRIARTVFVADDDKVAAAYGRTDPKSPFRFYYHQLKTKLTKMNRHVVFKEHKDQSDAEVTLDFVLDRLVICRHGEQGGRRDPRLPRARRRLRRAGVRRHGLGRRQAREALDAADGRGSDAARQRGYREAVRPPSTYRICPVT